MRNNTQTFNFAKLKNQVLNNPDCGRERSYSKLLALTKTGIWPYNLNAEAEAAFFFIPALEPSLPWKFGVKPEEVTLSRQ